MKVASKDIFTVCEDTRHQTSQLKPLTLYFNNMDNLEFIKEHCEKKGYTSRACRFQVIEDLMGISPEESKRVETITRTIREIFPKDEVGEKLENEWKRTPALLEFGNTNLKRIKQMEKDRLFYA